MKAPHAFNAVIAVVGVAPFAESLRVMGLQQIADGLRRVGWGFVALLAMSGARELVRALAWTRSIERTARLRLLPALRARLAGEALNTLLPMGMVVGEPTKASQAGDVPFGVALRALAIEFAFYAVSLVPLFAVGAAAFGVVASVRTGMSAMLGATAVAAIIAIAGVPLARRAAALSAMSAGNLLIIAACQAAYQVLAVAETYVTLRLIRPDAATLASAHVAPETPAEADEDALPKDSSGESHPVEAGADDPDRAAQS